MLYDENTKDLEVIEHELEEQWGTTPKPRDVYMGYNAHQEVMTKDYEMCRPYTLEELEMIKSFEEK